jgi:AraC-like DNA-binding protein
MMLVSDFSTERLPARERFDAWVDLGARSLTPMLVRSDAEDDFRAAMRVLALGEVQVCVLAYPSVRVHRTAKLIRRSDPEAYQVNLVLGGDSGARQAGREASFGVGEFILYDTSRVFEGWRACTPGTETITVQIPRTLMPLPANRVDRLTAVPFSTDRGTGALFARWLLDITARASEFTPADGPTLSSVTVDLLAAVLATSMDALLPESRRQVLRLQVHGFIEQRLADPALTPKAVAEAHHISVRQLQHLFATEGATPAAWIRHRRLERCRRDLANPHLRRLPVRGIAARWGFPDQAHFSRAFRAAYGVTPGDYRQAARESANGLRGQTMPEGPRARHPDDANRRPEGHAR